MGLPLDKPITYESQTNLNYLISFFPNHKWFAYCCHNLFQPSPIAMVVSVFSVISYIFFMFTLLYTTSTMSGKMKRVKVV